MFVWCFCLFFTLHRPSWDFRSCHEQPDLPSHYVHTAFSTDINLWYFSWLSESEISAFQTLFIWRGSIGSHLPRYSFQVFLLRWWIPDETDPWGCFTYLFWFLHKITLIFFSGWKTSNDWADLSYLSWIHFFGTKGRSCLLIRRRVLLETDPRGQTRSMIQSNLKNAFTTIK